MKIGYFGILIPEFNFWQGYFLTDENMDEARELVSNTRNELRKMQQDGVNVGEASVPFAGVAPEDQITFGSFVNTMVDCAKVSNHGPIGGLSRGLHLMGAGNYFLIRGKRVEGGMLSTFERMPGTISTPDRARDWIMSIPEVARMAQAQMRDALREGRGRRKH